MSDKAREAFKDWNDREWDGCLPGNAGAWARRGFDAAWAARQPEVDRLREALGKAEKAFGRLIPSVVARNAAEEVRAALEEK